MLKNLTINIIDNQSEYFYNYLGKVFGSRFIEKQIGLKVYDDNNKIWAISTIGGKLIGFCSLQARTISDCFVYPDYRGNGVFDAMLDSLLYPDKSYRAVCTPMSVRAFLKRDFNITKRTKNFQFVERLIA